MWIIKLVHIAMHEAAHATVAIKLNLNVELIQINLVTKNNKLGIDGRTLIEKSTDPIIESIINCAGEVVEYGDINNFFYRNDDKESFLKEDILDMQNVINAGISEIFSQHICWCAAYQICKKYEKTIMRMAHALLTARTGTTFVLSETEILQLTKHLKIIKEIDMENYHLEYKKQFYSLSLRDYLSIMCCGFCQIDLELYLTEPLKHKPNMRNRKEYCPNITDWRSTDFLRKLLHLNDSLSLPESGLIVKNYVKWWLTEQKFVAELDLWERMIPIKSNTSHLTKDRLAQFAAAALQGILSNDRYHSTKGLTKDAAEYARALVTELDGEI